MLYDNAGDRAVEDEKEDDVKWTLNVTRSLQIFNDWKLWHSIKYSIDYYSRLNVFYKLYDSSINFIRTFWTIKISLIMYYKNIKLILIKQGNNIVRFFIFP